MRHGWLDRLLGRHEWVETSRYYRLWWTVAYRCLVCGIYREGSEAKRDSRDPQVRAAAIADDEAKAARLREARR